MEKYLKLSVLTLVGLCFSVQAHAYLDPGTGSVIIQAVIAVFVAFGVFWGRVKSFLSGLFSRKSAGRADEVRGERLNNSHDGSVGDK